MTKIISCAAFTILAVSLSHAEDPISAVKEGIAEAKIENAALEKVKAIEEKSNWKTSDGWFYNIAKERENSFLIQKVRIIDHGINTPHEIATLSIHVDTSGSIKDKGIDFFTFPVDETISSFLDKGIISRDRGGVLGAIAGNVPDGCWGTLVPIDVLDDLAANVFPKYYEWEKIARDKNVSPFIKYFDGRKFYDTWDPKRGMTNVVEAHGGGEVVDEKKFQALKNEMLNQLDKDVKTSLQGGGFAHSAEIQDAVEKVRYNPGKQKYVDELNKAVSEVRKTVEGRVYNAAKSQGIIREVSYVPAVTYRDPAFEQEGWVFIWKEGKAYVYKIYNQQSYDCLNLFFNGSKSDAAIASLAGNEIFPKDVIDGFKVGYEFLQEVRTEASKHVSEYSVIQNQRSSQQEALFK